MSMETIKICVDVNVKFSEETVNVFRTLFGTNKPCSCAPTQPVQVAEKPAQVVEKPAQVVEKPTQVATLDIDIVRTALTKKVTTHRNAIKSKLESLGAPSVTKLDPSKYQEMYDFLLTLD